jgi:hypothetical protein
VVEVEEGNWRRRQLRAMAGPVIMDRLAGEARKQGGEGEGGAWLVMDGMADAP